jgi:2-amino-4-hydroxy-6-hydroxymethyldihydropteridine diphosphokinase
MNHRAYIGVGTNLGDRAANVERAFEAIAELGVVVARSSLYRTLPWGNTAQPWFLNAVVLLETQLAPRALLRRLQAVEADFGRVRRERWEPRVIDIDLLLYDDLELATPDLRVPHPHLRERAFVLVPLAELDGRFAEMRDALDATQLAGVVRAEREGEMEVFDDRLLAVRAHVRALADFLASDDAVRVRVQRDDVDIEIAAQPRGAARARTGERTQAERASARVDAIKADLVGIFHHSRPTPVEGETVDGDRELGYIEALGIRTPVNSMGAGQIVAVAAPDGTPVEYGQPLFLVARAR